MEVNLKIFRESDIRGVYRKDLDENVASDIGKAFGTFCGEGKKIVVARDARNSGATLKEAVIEGLVSVGCNVIDIGTVTTPMFFFTIAHRNLDGGICVTASHNPPEWNGFKLSKEKGMLCGEGFGMQEIKENFMKKSFNMTVSPGNVVKDNIYSEYKSFVLSKINTRKSLRILLDPGNGVSGYFAEDLFKSAGHDVSVINGKPDGSFPSRPSDPKEENVSQLKSEVVKGKFDMGIAFDGDADRIALIDDKGRYVPSGNVTIPMLSEYYLSRNKGARIVFDVCCSSVIESFVKLRGGVPIMSRIGQTFIKSKMEKEGAIFGGEYSNHLNFSEMYYSDDAMFGGLRIAEIVSFKNRSLSSLVDEIPRLPASSVLEIPCSDDMKYRVESEIVSRLKSDGYKVIDLDGVKAFDSEGNWMLIRASNTMPVIKINSEGMTHEKMMEKFELAKRLVEEGIRDHENLNN